MRLRFLAGGLPVLQALRIMLERFAASRDLCRTRKCRQAEGGAAEWGAGGAGGAGFFFLVFLNNCRQ